MTLSCIIFKYKPYSDILDTLEPFFFSVCVNPYSIINLYFQHNSSTLLLLSHSCLHQPFRLQTQKTRARPSHQESEDSVRRGQAHLFRTQKISSKKKKKTRSELMSLGDVKQRHRQDTCPHVCHSSSWPIQTLHCCIFAALLLLFAWHWWSFPLTAALTRLLHLSTSLLYILCWVTFHKWFLQHHISACNVDLFAGSFSLYKHEGAGVFGYAAKD